MRILLINAATSGHHLGYKELLDRALGELGHEVLHFSQSNEIARQGDPSFPICAKKSGHPSMVFFKSITVRWHIRQQALDKWELLSDYIRHLKKTSKRPDLLFFAYIDASIGQYLTKWDIESKLTVPFSGILFQPRDTRLMRRRFFRKGPFDPYNVLKSRWCKSVAVLMEEAIPFLSILIHKPVVELPDVISIPESVQDNSLGELIPSRAGGRFIIGLWGSLEQRKGISEFLKMVQKLPQEEYFFIIGGNNYKFKDWPENDKYLFQKGAAGNIENLLVIDRWLSDDELLSGLLSCDLIFAAYRDWRFSSGIIGKAAAARVPILVNDGFLMAKQVRNFSIGFVKEESSDVTNYILNNIETIIQLKRSNSFNAGCLEYCERFSYKQWRKSLARLIEP